MAFALETKFLGVDPLAVIEDEYNAVDDYIADGTDAFQAAITKAVGLHARDGGGSKRGPSANEQRSAEIRDGCDELHHTLRSIFDRNFDKFEMYTLKNLTNIPEHVVLQLEAAEQAKQSLPRSSDYTATDEEEARLRANIAALQTQLLEQRARRRALVQLKKRAESKVPRCEEVVATVAATMSDYVHCKSKDGLLSPDELLVRTQNLESAVLQLRSAFSL